MSAARCDRCGRFFRYGEEGSSWKFVPDTPFTNEECEEWCATCTQQHGRPRISQNRVARVDRCSGVVQAEAP